LRAEVRDAAAAIWRAALAAGDVGPLVHRHLRRDGSALAAGSRAFDLDRVRRVLVLGAGKAGAAMARAVEAVLGDRVSEGFVVVKDGYRLPAARVEIVEAGHPVPDARGLAAASRLLDLAAAATADDLVMVLLSGGGSALTPAPAPPVTLEDKQALTRLLLAAGATIGELNAVRKHLSRCKGGLLARAAAPAPVVTLALSDVVGDPLDVIASGPTAPDPTTYADALAVLARRGVLARAPGSIVERLRAGAAGRLPETPKPGDPLFERVSHVIVGNNALVVEAAAAEAERQGYRPHVLTRSLQGEAREVAREVVARARALAPPACLIAAGETTVTVRGQGRGGRCQEFALAAALELRADESTVVLAAGTDGTDGPTDAAGGLVDAGTAGRGRLAGREAARDLDDNDAGSFLLASGDAVVTGPTRTNLLDLYLIVRP
jgi:hydroxypyruvate reductase